MPVMFNGMNVSSKLNKGSKRVAIYLGSELVSFAGYNDRMFVACSSGVVAYHWEIDPETLTVISQRNLPKYYVQDVAGCGTRMYAVTTTKEIYEYDLDTSVVLHNHNHGVTYTMGLGGTKDQLFTSRGYDIYDGRVYEVDPDTCSLISSERKPGDNGYKVYSGDTMGGTEDRIFMDGINGRLQELDPVTITLIENFEDPQGRAPVSVGGTTDQMYSIITMNPNVLSTIEMVQGSGVWNFGDEVDDATNGLNQSNATGIGGTKCLT